MSEEVVSANGLVDLVSRNEHEDWKKAVSFTTVLSVEEAIFYPAGLVLAAYGLGDDVTTILQAPYINIDLLNASVTVQKTRENIMACNEA